MEKKLFIFDLDGTLIDAYMAIWETLLHTLNTLGYPPVDFKTAKRAVGYGDKNYIPRFFRPQHVDQASRIYREYHLKSLNGKIKLLPGAKKLLEELKRKDRYIAVASNRPSESGILIVRNLGIEKFFDKMVFGDQVVNQKPDPEILLKIIDFFRIDKKNTIFVGDMDIDANTGKKAGIDTFVVPTGSSTVQELKISNPSKICNSLFEILEMLQQGLL
ncbi:MAG: HAD family hydrolase [Candidatus Omnitrophica bacterium]|nr:HAD family hydrolase [Candidatus Omnitrophota bacterium]